MNEWMNLGNKYKNSFNNINPISKWRFYYQELILKRIFRYIMNTYDIENVLELGCGFGRISNYFNLKKWVGIDICYDELKAIKTGDKICCDLLCNIPLNDNSFDMVFSVDLLLHFKEEDFKILIEKIAKVGRILFLNCDWYNDNIKYKGVGCYNHNYRYLLKKFRKVYFWEINYFIGEKQRVYLSII